ncbi:hypothetical protein AMELA_G00276250 [Ameiurus melas]|uniref:Immunoglobulin V-set domain-containing protein n=1 Tax=Ameiurus melas TaxID=219545 RepID=A0A7J5ZPY8_AMEME|nr:hypothetical protein AMELA_G00276250 [Ameiurus melas]
MFSSTSRSAPVSEMETSRVALIALVCVVFSGQKRISGAEVETRVRRGDDVTLYSDCVVKHGFYSVWFRNCSHEDQPRLMVSQSNIMHDVFPRYSFDFNVSTNVHNLLIKNVTESDQGVYYCAIHEIKIVTEKDGLIKNWDVYHYGNRSTRLAVLGTDPPCYTALQTPRPRVYQSGVLAGSWVVSKVKADLAGSDKRMTRRRDEDEEDEVCYASLDIQNLKKTTKMKRKMRVQHSDFSTYSEVRTARPESRGGGDHDV